MVGCHRNLTAPTVVPIDAFECGKDLARCLLQVLGRPWFPEVRKVAAPANHEPVVPVQLEVMQGTPCFRDRMAARQNGCQPVCVQRLCRRNEGRHRNDGLAQVRPQCV